jgi:hypothetical protein
LFQEFVGTVAATVNTLGEGPLDIAQLMDVRCVPYGNAGKQGTVKDALGDVITSIRCVTCLVFLFSFIMRCTFSENIIIRRGFNINRKSNELLGTYVHGKIKADQDGDLLVVSGWLLEIYLFVSALSCYFYKLGQQLGVIQVHADGLTAAATPQIEATARKLAMHVVIAWQSNW